MEKIVKEGKGWRVGWNSAGGKYQALVGAEDWAIELTAAELEDFSRLLKQLVETMNAMQAELMDEEKIACEAASELLWLEVEGYPHSYSLRLIVNCDRKCEGNWQPGVAVELASAIQNLKMF